MRQRAVSGTSSGYVYVVCGDRICALCARRDELDIPCSRCGFPTSTALNNSGLLKKTGFTPDHSRGRSTPRSTVIVKDHTDLDFSIKRFLGN